MTTCPQCLDTNLVYRGIPECELRFTEDGAENVEHLPALRDYTCQNCGCNFMVLTEDQR